MVVEKKEETNGCHPYPFLEGVVNNPQAKELWAERRSFIERLTPAQLALMFRNRGASAEVSSCGCVTICLCGATPVTVSSGRAARLLAYLL